MERKQIEELEEARIIYEGHPYEIWRLKNPVDFTEQNEGIPTEGTHVLKGFDEDLLFVMEDHEDQFICYFMRIVGDTGLIVTLEDKEIDKKAQEIFQTALERLDEMGAE